MLVPIDDKTFDESYLQYMLIQYLGYCRQYTALLPISRSLKLFSISFIAYCGLVKDIHELSCLGN